MSLDLHPPLPLQEFLTLASMLFLHLFVRWRLIGLGGGMHAGEKVGRLDRCGGTGQQTSKRCASNQGLFDFVIFPNYLL